MALSVEETTYFTNLSNQLGELSSTDERLNRYYEGAQRLEHIGIAVPPELRRFETVVNWNRTAVDAIEERCDVKSLMLPGTQVADPGLQEAWDANNLDSEASLLHLDSLIYGRGFLCIGANEEDAEHPLITVESPRELTVAVDARTRRVLAGLRLYGGTPNDPDPVLATLYLPNVTIWLAKGNGRWVEVDRDEHSLGRVPVVPFFNRRRTGLWVGVSEMADVIPLVDAAARSLTNLQIAAETHSVPQKWVLGASKGDFVDAAGTPIPAWEAYYTAIWANGNKDVKVGQFTASDLKNFHDTVNHYANLVAGLKGLPMRYLGQNTANPPSADGIRADEARLVKGAERKCSQWGDQYGRAFAIYMRFRDGTWPDGNRIKVEWHDPATPTIAAKFDAVVKAKQSDILSREGAWDELGWSEARKERERGYFEAEDLDPIAERLLRPVTDQSAAEPVDDAPVG